MTYDTIQVKASAKQVFKEEASVSPSDLVRLLEASVARQDAGYLLYTAEHPSSGPKASRDAELFAQFRYGNYGAEYLRMKDLEELNRLVEKGRGGGGADVEVRDAAVAAGHLPTLPTALPD